MKTIIDKIVAKYNVSVEELQGAYYIDLLEDDEKELTGSDTLCLYEHKGVYNITHFKHMRSDEFKSYSTFTEYTKSLDFNELLDLFDECYNKIVKENTDFWKGCYNMLDELNIPQPFFRRKNN